MSTKDEIAVVRAQLQNIGARYVQYSGGEPIDPLGPTPKVRELASLYDEYRKLLARLGRLLGEDPPEPVAA